jgi:hypothetical protein
VIRRAVKFKSERVQAQSASRERIGRGLRWLTRGATSKPFACHCSRRKSSYRRHVLSLQTIELSVVGNTFLCRSWFRTSFTCKRRAESAVSRSAVQRLEPHLPCSRRFVQNVAGANGTYACTARYGQLRGVHFRDSQLFSTNITHRNARLKATGTIVALFTAWLQTVGTKKGALTNLR